MFNRFMPHIMDDDVRGFQTLRDTKVRSKRYIFVDKESLENGSKPLADYLYSQIRKGNVTGGDKIRDFISHLQNKKSIGSYFPVAKKGNDACISFNDTLLVFKNTEPEQVREFIRDDSQYTHTFSIRTVQWHTYNEIKSIDDPEKVVHFGASVKPRGSFSGALYIRNEDYYHEKYFTNLDFTRTEHNQNPHFDMGAAGLTFYLTKEQAKNAHIKLQHDLIESKQNHLKYSFLGLWGGRNCSDYSNDFFKFLGFEDDFANYFIFDELDDRDQGIFYIMMNHGRFSYLISHPIDTIDFICFKLTGDSLSKYVHDNTMWVTSWSSSLYNKINFYGDKQIHMFAYGGDTSRLDDQGYDCDDLNCQNDFGQTPLHIATFYEKYDFANKILEMSADVDKQDAKGHTPIYYAALLKPSNEKLELLDKMAKLSNNINAVDITGEQTALTAAVIANDSEALEVLMNNGANASFMNKVGNNLMHIALMNKSYDIIETLHKADINLIHSWNGEYQIPAVEIKKMDNAEEILPDIEKHYDPMNVLSESQLYHEYLKLDFI